MRLMSRSLFTAVATVGLALLTAGTASAAPFLLHEFKLNGNLDNENVMGPDLTQTGGTVGGSGFTYGYGEGLTLAGGLGGPASGNYTIEIDFSLSDVSQSEYGVGGWQKILDFANFSTDTGLYFNTGGIDPMPQGFGLYGQNAWEWGMGTVSNNQPAKLWLTRNDVGWVEGRLGGSDYNFTSAAFEFGFDDSADQDFVFASNIIHFFMDDETATLDNGQGFVDNIRIYGGSALDIGGAPIPEPATLLLFGSGMAFVARRVRRRQAAE